MRTNSHAPALWTSWRDKRDDTTVTVVGLNLWDTQFAELRLEVHAPGQTRHSQVQRISRAEFEAHFEMIYDPHTGWERAA